MLTDAVLRSAVGPLLNEPRAPDPPTRVWRDWALLIVLLVAGVAEAVLTVELTWLPVSLVVGVVPMVTILWRRTHPLATTAIAFCSVAVVSVLIMLGVPPSVSLYASLYVFLLSYSAFRWGSGREAAFALAIMMTVHALTEFVSFTGAADVVVGASLYLFAAALGASLRYRASSQLRETEKMQLVERERLARELHDTVAHYVTAIAVQAEAGLAKAETGQGGAVETLEAIKLAASSALSEMRILVGLLRQGEDPELAPQNGLADLELLARRSGTNVPVDIEIEGDLGAVVSPVGAAIYRIAQESITNVVRHSPDATLIRVSVVESEEYVKVVVSNDGVCRRTGSAGWGIVGMTERVTVLGGTIDAGPGANEGWTVAATFPVTETKR